MKWLSRLLLLAASVVFVGGVHAQTTAGFTSLLEKREVPAGTSLKATSYAEPLFQVDTSSDVRIRAGHIQYWQRVGAPYVKGAQITSFPDEKLRRVARGLGWQNAFDDLREKREEVALGVLLDVEPDLNCVLSPPGQAGTPTATVQSTPNSYVEANSESGIWPLFEGADGYLSDDYSQLHAAYRKVFSTHPAPAVIAILDVGFLSRHTAFPTHAKLPPADIADPERPPEHVKPGEPYYPPPPALNGPTHGTATSAILAAPPRTLAGATEVRFFSGGNPDAVVIPIRIGHSVIAAPLPVYSSRLGDIARGFDQASRDGAEILSMSVGGTPSRALDDSVNNCYIRGVAMFCATGDYLRARKAPFIRSPWFVVYPAAFRNVMGVCGVTADRKPYGVPDDDSWKDTLLLGNFGPKDRMENVIAGWAPNIPWVAIPAFPAKYQPKKDPWNIPGEWNRFDLDGSGTSSATPQVAATASLVLEAHRCAFRSDYAEPWQRIEAIYAILRESAEKPSHEDAVLFFGNGFLRAQAAIEANPPAPAELTRHRAKIGFYWLRLLASAFLPPPVFKENDEPTLRQELGKILHTILPGLSDNRPDPGLKYNGALVTAIDTELTRAIAESVSAQEFLAPAPQPLSKADRHVLLTILLRDELSTPTRAFLERLATAP